MVSISVVICTHNPRAHFLERVLAALRSQTLPFEAWELLVIDNASAEPVAKRFDLSWHPAAQHVREDELGLTPARLRGIAETNGDVIVFVDDDNVLDADYLAGACDIAEQHPHLGVWGGSVRPEFESPPEPWTHAFFELLAIRDADQVRWSNTLDDWRAQPVGAGLCVRRPVATYYAQRVRTDPLRKMLGRRGGSMTSGEDVDLIYGTRDIGLGFGTFPQLSLIHLMPEDRLSKKKLLKLVEGISTSNVLLSSRYGRSIEETVLWKTMLRSLLLLATKGFRETQFYLARKRGTKRGKELIASLQRSSTAPVASDPRTSSVEI